MCVCVCVCVCVCGELQTVEYDSAIKKNEILPFATTWMELEGIMLSEISQRKTNIIWLHSYEDFKRQKQMNIRGGKQKYYKNREGDKTEETHKYGEQRVTGGIMEREMG